MQFSTVIGQFAYRLRLIALYIFVPCHGLNGPLSRYRTFVRFLATAAASAVTRSRGRRARQRRGRISGARRACRAVSSGSPGDARALGTARRIRLSPRLSFAPTLSDRDPHVTLRPSSAPRPRWLWQGTRRVASRPAASRLPRQLRKLASPRCRVIGYTASRGVTGRRMKVVPTTRRARSVEPWTRWRRTRKRTVRLTADSRSGAWKTVRGAAPSWWCAAYACACARTRVDHPVLRGTTGVTNARHDDGDPGVRGGAVQHILGARRADMLLRGLPLHHEARIHRVCTTVSFSFFHLPVRPSVLPSCARTRHSRAACACSRSER